MLLWVRDQGIGMTPEETKAVRERFVRATAAVQRAPGSRLGLNIVDSIVEAHGGHLDIESVPKGGSVFTLRIPVNPASPYSSPIGPRNCIGKQKNYYQRHPKPSKKEQGIANTPPCWSA